MGDPRLCIILRTFSDGTLAERTLGRECGKALSEFFAAIDEEMDRASERGKAAAEKLLSDEKASLEAEKAALQCWHPDLENVRRERDRWKKKHDEVKDESDGAKVGMLFFGIILGAALDMAIWMLC